MQDKSSKLLKDNPNTDQSSENIILWIGVALPLLVFIASSGYAAIALWRAKSLQALAPAGLPFGIWVGNDITWAMKLSILSAGYFSVLLTYFTRKLLWQEKAKLGVLALLTMVQGLLCLDYIAKLQWFADDGVTAKGLVIIGFTAINLFLLAQKPLKEKMAGLFLFNRVTICNISMALSGLGLSIFWHGGSLARLFLEISGHAIPFRKLGFLLAIVGSLPCLYLRLQAALPSVAENSQQNISTLPAIYFIWARRIVLLTAYLAGASLLLKINGLLNVPNQFYVSLLGIAAILAYTSRFSQKLHIFREPPQYLKISYEIAIVFFAICSVIFGAGILNGKPMQSLYEVTKFWLLGLFVLNLLSHKNISKAIVWVLGIWVLSILCIYIFAIIVHPSFGGSGDNIEWFTTTAIGKPFPLNFDNSRGRFYPLGHITYNWLIYFPFRNSAIPYLLQNAITLIAGTTLLYFSMPRKNVANQIASLCSLLFILQPPAMLVIFIDIVYPEKNLFLFFAWFLFALRYAEKKKTSYLRYISALVPLVLATYSKEPIFVISLVYGLGRLLFCKDTKAQKLFNSLLIVNAIVFLLLYYRIAYIPGPNYAMSLASSDPIWVIAWNLLSKRTYGIYILPIFLTIFRCYRFLLKKDRNFIMADMLLFSGLAYTVCYFILGLSFRYYYIPGFIIGFYAVASYISHYINLKNIQRINWNPSTRLITVFALLVLQLLLFLRPMENNLWAIQYYQKSRKDFSSLSKELYNLIEKEWSIYNTDSVVGFGQWYNNIFNTIIWWYNKQSSSDTFHKKNYVQYAPGPVIKNTRFRHPSLIFFNRTYNSESLRTQLFELSPKNANIYYLGRTYISMQGIHDAYSIGEIPEDFVEKFGLRPIKLPPPVNTEPITEQKIEEE